MFFIVVDEAVGRRIVAFDRRVAVQFGQDGPGQLFSEFNPPLIEAVDAPNDTLRENLVLVEGKQSSEVMGRDLVHHDGIGGAIAAEAFVRGERLNAVFRKALGTEFGSDFVLCLTEHQRFGLGKEVGEERFMVRALGIV